MSEIGPVFSERTGRMIGRQKEIERLQRHLHDRGPRRFIYYHAIGGLGKTRLLLELQEMVRNAGPGFYTTGIIDLYHTDTHSTSDIERAVVEGLDPENRRFPQYRSQRDHYEVLRERGADPAVLEERRAALSEAFVHDCRDMALDANKLVLCFDTIELLQYESTVMEEFAGLDSVDARVKPWLLEKLARLNNVLVVFAGRPKKPPSAHERLQQDMRKAFGEDLDIVPLEPLSASETDELIKELAPAPGAELVPAELLPIVHKLTGGTPILLYLLADSLKMALELQPVYDLFRRHLPLLRAPESSRKLRDARAEVKKAIVKTIFNEQTELGYYLGRIALMPKGVDEDILHVTLGMATADARALLGQLRPLSFVKRFVAPPGAERLHGERIFLHDEMYDLMTLRGAVPHMRSNELAVTRPLAEDYYPTLIAQLQRELQLQAAPDGRAALHERLQKLQVERLYYLLAYDPAKGYEEYRALSRQANYERRVGYSMRLLDEFLRFFHASRESKELRKELTEAGITEERVIRDSAQMWVERFWWWGQPRRVQELGKRILEQPEALSIDPEQHMDILGNVCALWTRALAIQKGYNEQAVSEAEAMVKRLPPLGQCSAQEALARARLLVTAGYLRRLGGHLQAASQAYTESKGSFQRAGHYPNEYSMLLNNLAHVHALQGRFVEARTLAHEALDLNEKLGDDYAKGLTLTTLASIAAMRGNYSRAVEYGQEALTLFQQLEDSHGTALAHLGLGRVARLQGKHETQVGRHLDEARQRLNDALGQLKSGEAVLNAAGSGGEHLTPIRSELGRTHRDLGNLYTCSDRPVEALESYREAERVLEEVLREELGPAERANALEDLAEALFMSGNAAGAKDTVREVEQLIGPEYQIIPGEKTPAGDLSTELFSPLGKTELLRGQMAFAAGKPKEGIRHYLLAYAYFKCFSPDAVQLDMLVQYLYRELKVLAPDVQRDCMGEVQRVVEKDDHGVDVTGFARILTYLLGT